MAEISFNMRPQIIQGSNLDNTHSSNDTIYIEYNNYYPAGTLVSKYRIEARLDLANVAVHDDLSVSFDYGGIRAVRAYTTHSTSAKGYNVDKILDNGKLQRVWNLKSDIGLPFDSGWINVATQPRQHYVVPPNGTISIPEIRAFKWLASAVVSDECAVFVGGKVTNVIPMYQPNGLRKSNEWKAVQFLQQSTWIRTSNNWNDVGHERIAYIGRDNTGQTRRRQSGIWKQEGMF
ncbi:hypothetical protein [Streptococcus phage vB_SbRt-pBovineS21]|nr:hypothetical protein [Streptococcus phage vB_SbRt-pBovineS21]